MRLAGGLIVVTLLACTSGTISPATSSEITFKDCDPVDANPGYTCRGMASDVPLDLAPPGSDLLSYPINCLMTFPGATQGDAGSMSCVCSQCPSEACTGAGWKCWDPK
jgi:hypothetical protein